MIDDFSGAGKIVRTKHLLKNVPGKITMTAAGPTRSFGPPEPGLLYEEPLPDVECSHRDYFVNFINAYYGKEELMVKMIRCAVFSASWMLSENLPEQIKQLNLNKWFKICCDC